MPISNEQLIGTVTPNVYIDKITLESHSDNGLRVSINLVIKDIVNNPRNTAWFNQKELKKVLKVKIVQATTAEQYMTLSNRGNNSSVNFALNDPWLLENQLQSKITSLSTFEPDDSEVFKKYEPTRRRSSTTDSDGNIITDFTYRVSFYLDDPNPQHLSYFCFSYVDPMEFQEAFGIEIPSNFDKLNGKVSSDVVFRNSNLVSEAIAFYDDKNEIWPGPVHKMSGGRWMTGAEHSNKNKYLTERSVPNTKVQDFRIMARLSDAQIDLSILEPVSFDYGKKPKVLRNDGADIYKKQSYFTNAWPSRDEDNNSNFLFGMDLRSFIKHNSRYGKLMDNALPSTVEEIIRLSKIRELKIYRKRIKNTPNINSLGSYEKPEERFDDILESDQMLLITGDLPSGIKAVDNDLAYIKEEKNINMPMDNVSSRYCRYFSVSDRKLKEFTYGLYQYGVEIKLEDGTVAYLQNILARLKSSRKLLSSYLVEAPIGYNPVTQKFTPNFILEQNTKLVRIAPNQFRQRALENSPWIRPVTEYLNAFYTLTGDRSVLDKAQGISNLISPADGNLVALEAFVLQYDKLLTSFHDMLGQSSSVRNSQGMLPASSEAESNSYSHGSSRIPLFLENKHWFVNAPIDAENFSTSGISYFSTKDNSSIRKVTVEEFIQRQQFEREKINRQPQLAQLANSFSILSPSYIKVNGVIGDENDTADPVAQILSINFPGILKEAGVSISNAKSPTLIPLVLQQTSVNELVFSVNSPASVARNIDLEVEPTNEQPSDPPMASSVAASQFQSQFLIQMVESSKTIGLPNSLAENQNSPRPQVLAEVLEDVAAGAVAPMLEDIDLSWVYDIDWSLVKEIKVLTGYESSSRGEKMLKGEKWVTLTNQLYADDRLREKTLLCKIVPYSSKELGIKYNNNLELSTYNEYFLLQGAPKISISTPTLAATTSATTTQNDHTVRPKLQDKLASNYRVSTTVSNQLMTTGFRGLK